MVFDASNYWVVRVVIEYQKEFLIILVNIYFTLRYDIQIFIPIILLV